jgi:polyphosphate kinase
MTAAEQLRTIRTRVDENTYRAVRLFQDELTPALEKEGIRFVDWSLLDQDDHAWLTDVFHSRIFPVLTPLAVDPGHPFPTSRICLSTWPSSFETPARAFAASPG